MYVNIMLPYNVLLFSSTSTYENCLLLLFSLCIEISITCSRNKWLKSKNFWKIMHSLCDKFIPLWKHCRLLNDSLNPFRLTFRIFIWTQRLTQMWKVIVWDPFNSQQNLSSNNFPANFLKRIQRKQVGKLETEYEI